MPAYKTAGAEIALYPGDVGASFSAEAVPVAGTAGRQFALPSPPIPGDGGRSVRWQTLFTTAPDAIGISLQAAMADVEAEYKDIDSSTTVTGEAKTVADVIAKFLRVKVTSVTVGSGAGFTAKILV